jgi:arylsulfatase A-like enzyme
LLRAPTGPLDVDAETEPAVFAQYAGDRYMLRTRKWKYIENAEDQTVELFDLEADPAELQNLAKHQPERVEAFRKSVLDRLAEIRAGGR